MLFSREILDLESVVHGEVQNSGTRLAAIATIPLFLVLVLPVFTLVFPVEISWAGVTLYDWHRVAVVATLAVSGLLILGRRQPMFIPSGSLVSIGGMVVLGGGSLLLNNVPFWGGAREVAMLLQCYISVIVIGSAFAQLASDEQQRITLLCLAGSALIYLAVFITSNEPRFTVPELMGIPPQFPAFSNIRFFTDYQALVMPFTVMAVATYCRHVVARIFGWSGIFMFWMLFYYSGSRALVLGQIVAHAMLWLLLGRSYARTLRFHLVAWVGGYFTFLFFSQTLPWLLSSHGAETEQLMRGTISDRLLLWMGAWQDFLSHPLLGIGPGEFARQHIGGSAAPHNSLLMIAAEWGLPALVLWLWSLGAILWPGLQSLRVRYWDRIRAKDFSIASWLAVLALLAHSLVANVLVIPTSQLSLVVAIGLVMGDIKRHDGLPPLVTNYGLKAAIILVSGLLMLILFRDFQKLPQQNAAYVACPYPTSNFSPRFWQQGWLGMLPCGESKTGFR
ncbi:MAG: O-antigen ligase domain-containing protein [Rhodocyclaceae bacterium]|nr:MAG: O-antigen ligase domain-containing protein [Rhodocyclaceae bacterium]